MITGETKFYQIEIISMDKHLEEATKDLSKVDFKFEVINLTGFVIILLMLIALGLLFV